MAALDPQFMAILKKVLNDRFVPHLPRLLDERRPPEEQTAKQASRAFSAFALHKLLGLLPREAAAAVVDDFQDRGLDAIYYHAPKETLYLLQTKLKASEQFKQDEAQAFCDGVRTLLRQDFAAFNAHVQRRQAEIEGALGACSHIQLVVPYTGDGVTRPAIEALDALLDDVAQDDERVTRNVLYYSAEEITRDLRAEQAYHPVHTDLRLQHVHKVEEPRATYYGVAQLADLVALHEQHDKGLYERNIRYFLGSGTSEVNRAIKATLLDNPADFFYLNNGVTAVCDSIDPKEVNRAGFKKLRVRGLSIINGAQTVASAAEFVARNPGHSITNAKVMFTLIKAPADGAFGKRVTKARNHQNPVQAANFASLDETQERLRQEAAHLGFEYHYRPEVLVRANGRVITLEEALRALATLHDDPRYPVWLKSEPARLSNPDGTEYQRLFDAQLTGAALINAVLCSRVIRDLLLSSELRAPSRSQERLIYRHGVHAITAVLMKRLRTKIRAAVPMDPATLPALLSLPFDELRQQAFDTARGRLIGEGPLAYFRNQSNVGSFIADLMATNYGRAADPDLAAIRHVAGAAEAYPRKRLFDYLSPRAPQL
jgi:hypothetical protein